MAARRLLLIEDNGDNRMLIKFALESKTDWKVLTATNGIEGISKAETERPDVILLDLVMPDLDGLTVYEVLRSNLFTCTIPTIFITAMVEARVLARLEATLAAGIITKPFDITNLDTQIAKMCQWEINSQLKPKYSNKQQLIEFL